MFQSCIKKNDSVKVSLHRDWIRHEISTLATTIKFIEWSLFQAVIFCKKDNILDNI